jgi:hypothetical protein
MEMALEQEGWGLVREVGWGSVKEELESATEHRLHCHNQTE